MVIIDHKSGLFLGMHIRCHENIAWLGSDIVEKLRFT